MSTKIKWKKTYFLFIFPTDLKLKKKNIAGGLHFLVSVGNTNSGVTMVTVLDNRGGVSWAMWSTDDPCSFAHFWPFWTWQSFWKPSTSQSTVTTTIWTNHLYTSNREWHVCMGCTISISYMPIQCVGFHRLPLSLSTNGRLDLGQIIIQLQGTSRDIFFDGFKYWWHRPQFINKVRSYNHTGLQVHSTQTHHNQPVLKGNDQP